MEKLPNKVALSTDQELIQKIIEGETALFELLIRRYNSLLYKLARTYGLNHQNAEDIMQETHFTAFTQLKNFRHEASYKTWITKILLHKCYHKLNYGNMKYEEPNNELINDKTAFMNPLSSRLDTESVIMNKELAAILEQSLQQLPSHYRSVFVLREIEGFKVDETAELLNITPANVKVRLSRAKTMLQKHLEYYYSSTDLYEFNLKYCDKIVKNVFKKIDESKGQ